MQAVDLDPSEHRHFKKFYPISNPRHSHCKLFPSGEQ